jgi:hypothetical protein
MTNKKIYLNNINEFLLIEILDYLEILDITLLKECNNYFNDFIKKYTLDKINYLLKNNYITPINKNIIKYNHDENKFISNSEILYNLNNLNKIYIIGQSIYDNNKASLYMFYYHEYFKEYKFKYLYEESIQLNGLQMEYLGGDIYFFNKNSIKIYNIISKKIYIFDNLYQNPINFSALRTTKFKNNIYIMQSFWNSWFNDMNNINDFIEINNEYPKCILYKYNIELNKIEKVNFKINTPRRYHAMIEFEDKLWIIGGINCSLILNSVEVYDPLTELCTEEQNKMCHARYHFHLIVYKSDLYAVGGGINDNTSIEKFNKVTRTWSVITYFNFQVYYPSVSLIKETIFLFGGIGDDYLWSSYNIELNKWNCSINNVMPFSRCFINSSL